MATDSSMLDAVVSAMAWAPSAQHVALPIAVALASAMGFATSTGVMGGLAQVLAPDPEDVESLSA